MGVAKNGLNFGLIGYKFMGKAHSNALKKVNMFFDPTLQANLTAICGRDEAGVKQAAEKFGWASYETSWEALIKRDDIDVIDITTPNNTHKDIAVEAAKNKKHIFCEKPLAMNVTEARVMLKEAEKAGIKHQIGFNYRFAPAVQLAKQLIAEGKLGKIYHFRGTYLQDWLLDPEFPAAWRTDKNVAGSGSHGDLGSHLIDLARFLVGDFKSVIGITKTFVKERPEALNMTGLSATKTGQEKKLPVTVDDASLFLCEFENGALGTFEATRFAAGHKNGMAFEVNGSEGSVRFEFERMNELQYYNVSDPAGLQGFRLIQATETVHPYAGHWWPVGHVIGYEHTFVHELYEFIQSVYHDKPCVPNFYDGVKCCQILDAVQLSAAERTWVDVDKV
jgi:predicted dehydrogenase